MNLFVKRSTKQVPTKGLLTVLALAVMLLPVPAATIQTIDDLCEVLSASRLCDESGAERFCDPAGTSNFSDVEGDDYAAAYILCMKSLGLSQGKGAGAYGPHDELTRAQMASFLARLWRLSSGEECPVGSLPFTDVDPDSTHRQSIDCLHRLGVAKGKTASTFAPGEEVTAAQLSLFLLRTYQVLGGECAPAEAELELDQALVCLTKINVIPSESEGRSGHAVLRAQMAVYVIGLWHNLTDRGLPPFPPTLPTPKALLMPTGVPVAVLGRTENGYLVRSPCDNTVEVGGGEPIPEGGVVIDPGHGGPYDTGAWGSNGLVERDLNLDLGKAIAGELHAWGIPAVLTRTDNYAVRLSVRAGLADALGAQALVSLHHNAPRHNSRRTPGTEVYVQSESARSARLGGLLYEEIFQALDNAFDIAWSGTRFTGVSRVLLPSGGDAFGMIRRPATPAALVEFGYIANRAEANLFATPEYVAVASEAAAQAIRAYLETDRPGTGFHEAPRIFNPNRASSRCLEVPLE